ncbi:TPA: hypothetical protein ACW72U_004113 [Enterobacter ludwigii]|uniref:hypothetical protein n=1 Tax=Leclercia sp. TaxID=1898428 RepID=UPI0028ACE109|nr:hypothetical protein [Leclercia sp.]
MRRFFAIFLLISSFNSAAAVLNCEYASADLTKGASAPMIPGGSAKVEFDGATFKAFRPYGHFVLSPRLVDRKNGMLYLDDKTKIFVAHPSGTEFAVSDRIAKKTEQWANCSEDKIASQQNKDDDEIKRIESMSPSEAKKYFLNEKHAFTTNCLVWDDVTMITGRNPAIIMAGSVNMGKSPRWDGREYSFTFNGGSMIARFVPSEPRHKFVIQGGDKFYGCGPSVIDHNYD